MDFKLLGCILLIIGTSIGAGMLALPVVTAQLGFLGALILLVFCWFIMTAGAFLLLEVNLWMRQNSNIITMARSTIGPLGQIIAWLTYFLLLYSLLCAYIAGGSDLLHDLLWVIGGIRLPKWIAAIIFTLIFGTIVYLGIRAVDYANRGLMLFKFIAYFLLIILLMPLVSSANLLAGDLPHITQTQAIFVTITSFGYASIIPSLRVYFQGDITKLKAAILWGSLIPLLCYIVWDAAIMGIIPIEGEHGLLAILHSQSSTSDLADTLSTMAGKSTITFFAKLFTSICVLTSFLGVAISLADFLADGLRLEKKGSSNFYIHAIAFIPPLVIVIFTPGIFVQALEYAGVYCIILLSLLPAWMAWCGRYRRHLLQGFTVWGGKPLLVILILFAFIMIVRGVLG